MEKCKNCGHECHCYEGNCYECINDVCTVCDCKENATDSYIPDSFIKSPG